jgi:SAM-dependent methyltransferase
MPCSCCGFEHTAGLHFTQAKAAKELQQYRLKGPGRTTRLLLDGLTKAGLAHGSLLDVGAGIGTLTLEMIKRGTTNASVVDASSAYLTAASEEATRLLPRAQIQFVHGDFVSIADQMPAADVVTLDRVICCYPLYEPLLAQALRHAERGFAYSYPRDRWYVKVVVWLENVIRSRKSSFRTFVHPESQMKQLIEDAGFELVTHDSTIAWSADVFVKRQRVS